MKRAYVTLNKNMDEPNSGSLPVTQAAIPPLKINVACIKLIFILITGLVLSGNPLFSQNTTLNTDSIIIELNQKINRLESTLKVTDEENKNCKIEKEKLIKKLEQSENEVKKLNLKKDSIFSASTIEIGNLKNDIINQKALEQNLSSKLLENLNRVDSFSIKLNEAKSENISRQKEIIGLNRDLITARGEKEITIAQLDARELALKQKSEELDNEKQITKQQISTNEVLKSELENISQQKTSLENIKAQKENELNLLKDNISKLDTEITEAKLNNNILKGKLKHTIIGIAASLLIFLGLLIIWFLLTKNKVGNYAELIEENHSNPLYKETVKQLVFYKRASGIVKYTLVIGVGITLILYMVITVFLLEFQIDDLTQLLNTNFWKVLGAVGIPLLFFTTLFSYVETKKIEVIKILNDMYHEQ